MDSPYALLEPPKLVGNLNGEEIRIPNTNDIELLGFLFKRAVPKLKLPKGNLWMIEFMYDDPKEGVITCTINGGTIWAQGNADIESLALYQAIWKVFEGEK